jgi:hypothetical protein
MRRVVSRNVSIAVSTVVLYELWYGVARSQLRMPSDCASSFRETLILFHSKKRMPSLQATCAQRWKQQERRLAPMTC